MSFLGVDLEEEWPLLAGLPPLCTKLHLFALTKADKATGIVGLVEKKLGISERAIMEWCEVERKQGRRLVPMKEFREQVRWAIKLMFRDGLWERLEGEKIGFKERLVFILPKNSFFFKKWKKYTKTTPRNKQKKTKSYKKKNENHPAPLLTTPKPTDFPTPDTEEEQQPTAQPNQKGAAVADLGPANAEASGPESDVVQFEAQPGTEGGGKAGLARVNPDQVLWPSTFPEASEDFREKITAAFERIGTEPQMREDILWEVSEQARIRQNVKNPYRMAQYLAEQDRKGVPLELTYAEARKKRQPKRKDE